MRLSTGSVS